MNPGEDTTLLLLLVPSRVGGLFCFLLGDLTNVLSTKFSSPLWVIFSDSAYNAIVYK